MKRRPPKLSLDVLRLRDFRLLLLARIFTPMAMQAQAVIVGWQIYSLTRDPLMLGLAGLAEALPALICAIIAGYVVDKSRPHLVYVSCIAVLALNAFGLLLVAGGYVSAPFGSVVGYIYFGVIVSGIARAFAMPASFSLMPQIVPRRLLSAGSAWLTSGFQVGTITAPALAGLIYGGYGPGIAWMIPAGFLLISVLVLALLETSIRLYRNERTTERALTSIKAGWSYIWTNRIVFSVMALDMFAVLLGGAVALLPAYAAEVLHVGSEGLGLLRAAPALGSVVVGLCLAVWPLQMLRGTTLLVTVAGFGLCMIGFGLSTSFAFSMLFLAMSGGFDNVSMVMRQTILQIMTPPDMRGRVSGINSMFIISSNELGAFESGLAAKLLGLIPSVVLGGFGTLLVVAVTAFASPQLRRMVIDTSEPARH